MPKIVSHGDPNRVKEHRDWPIDVQVRCVYCDCVFVLVEGDQLVVHQDSRGDVYQAIVRCPECKRPAVLKRETQDTITGHVPAK